MDSLTQMVLGAAVGEAVLGKKIANRAMIWGAIGGTIPDLDIIAYSFMNPIDALAAHRGISHSLVFGLLFPFVFAYLPHWIYGQEWYKKRWYRWMVSLMSFAFVSLFAYLVFSIFSSVFSWSSVTKWVLVLSVSVFTGYALMDKYLFRPPTEVQSSYSDWVKLFVAAIITHPLLDAFTPYGTQLFQPFSDYRVAFNTISIVDPLYTVPFISCLIIASRHRRQSKRRTFWNLLGLSLSSLYLLWTVIVHQHVVAVVKHHIESQELAAERFVCTPTIFNTVLWNVIVEYADHYTLEYYSLFDKRAVPSNRIRVEKNHELLASYQNEPSYRILKWFSNDYFALQKSESKYLFYDLRYTSRSSDWSQPQFIFGFEIKPKGKILEIQERRNRPKSEDRSKMLRALWTRIKGV